MPPVYSYDQIAYQLTDLGQQYFGETRQSYAVSSGGTITYNVAPLNAAGREFARSALIFGRSRRVSILLKRPRMR